RSASRREGSARGPLGSSRIGTWISQLFTTRDSCREGSRAPGGVPPGPGDRPQPIFERILRGLRQSQPFAGPGEQLLHGLTVEASKIEKRIVGAANGLAGLLDPVIQRPTGFRAVGGRKAGQLAGPGV